VVGGTDDAAAWFNSTTPVPVPHGAVSLMRYWR
jgi:hypothetical protein